MSTGQVNTVNHKIYLQYATVSEITALANMHPQKSQIKQFALAMKLFKEKNANDPKYTRTYNKAIGLLSNNAKAMALVEELKARAKQAVEEAEVAATTATAPAAPVQMTKVVKFNDGVEIEAVREIIPAEQLKEYVTHPSNRRNQENLSLASISDILPTAALKGIREETYTYIDGDKKVTVEGSRRTYAGIVLGIPVPTWRFLKPLTPAQVEEISRESDDAKKKHGYHEAGMAMLLAIKLHGFTTLVELLNFYNVVPTTANRKAYSRVLSITLLSPKILSRFMDYESLSLRHYLDLYDQQRTLLNDEELSSLIGHRKVLNYDPIIEVFNDKVEAWDQKVDDEFNELASAHNIARRFADAICSLPNKNDSIVSVTTIKDRLAEHTSKKTDYDPKGQQTSIRKYMSDLMLTHLEIDEFTDPELTIDASKLRHCIEPFLKLYEADISNAASAYNADIRKFIAKLLPKKSEPAKKGKAQRAKPVLVTLFEDGDTSIKFSEVVESEQEQNIVFNMVHVSPEKRQQFLELATKFFKDDEKQLSVNEEQKTSAEA